MPFPFKVIFVSIRFTMKPRNVQRWLVVEFKVIYLQALSDSRHS